MLTERLRKWAGLRMELLYLHPLSFFQFVTKVTPHINPKMGVQIPIKFFICCCSGHLSKTTALDPSKPQHSLKRWCAPTVDRQVEWDIKLWQWGERSSWQGQTYQAVKMPSLFKGMSHYKHMNNRRNQLIWEARLPSAIVVPHQLDRTYFFKNAQRHLQFGGRTEKWVLRLSNERSVR